MGDSDEEEARVQGRSHSKTILEIKHKTEKKLSVYGNVDCPHNPNVKWRSAKPHPSLQTGRALLSVNHPVYMALLVICLPACFVALLYGGLPLGDPNGDFVDGMTYVFVFTPWTFTAYGFLMIAFFLGCLDTTSPWAQWTAYVPVTFFTYLLTTLVMLVIWATAGSFRALGFIPYGVTWCTIIASLWLFRKFHSSCTCDFYVQRRAAFVKIMVLNAFMFALFTAYTLIFREVSGVIQKAMSAGWVFVLLFIKKGGLAITEVVQIELAMLISGFYLQNTFDTFFVLVYPNVEDPTGTFLIIWLAQAFGDFAYLIFLTNWWFRFRVWVKAFLKRFFCPNIDYEREARGVTVDLDPDDRGQSRMQPGYRRRQVQFYFYRLLSSMTAQIFYLIAGPVLRWWNNGDYFPFSEETTRRFSEVTLDDESFRNSLIFAMLRVIWVVAAALIGFIYIRKFYRETFDQLRTMYHNLLVAPLFFGFIFSSVLANQLLAAWLMMAHNQIWFLPVE